MRFWSSCVLVAALVAFSLMSLTSDFSVLIVAADRLEASCAAVALFCASEVAFCRFDSCCCVCWITASFCCSSVFRSCSCCCCCIIIWRIAARSLCVTAEGFAAVVRFRVVFFVVVVVVLVVWASRPADRARLTRIVATAFITLSSSVLMTGWKSWLLDLCDGGLHALIHFFRQRCVGERLRHLLARPQHPVQ